MTEQMTSLLSAAPDPEHVELVMNISQGVPFVVEAKLGVNSRGAAAAVAHRAEDAPGQRV